MPSHSTTGDRVVEDVVSSGNRLFRAAYLQRFRTSIVYDVLTRLPLVVWLAFCGQAMWTRFSAYWSASPAVNTAFVLNVLAQMSAIVFVLMVILALAWRRPAIARTPGLLPRAVAFGGAFSITGLAFFEPVAHSVLVSGVSLGLICVGYAFACYSLLHLGRSLSLMAEARKLVTSGPYAWVRHPLYLAYGIASIGLLLQYLSVLAVALWAIHIGLQLWRMHYEEAVLRENFPEYDAYARRVARIVPHFY
jgi:protein-S-isoprenylcysteine O-methyltransferase Ste14